MTQVKQRDDVQAPKRIVFRCLLKDAMMARSTGKRSSRSLRDRIGSALFTMFWIPFVLIVPLVCTAGISDLIGAALSPSNWPLVFAVALLCICALSFLAVVLVFVCYLALKGKVIYFDLVCMSIALAMGIAWSIADLTQRTSSASDSITEQNGMLDVAPDTLVCLLSPAERLSEGCLSLLSPFPSLGASPSIHPRTVFRPAPIQPTPPPPPHQGGVALNARRSGREFSAIGP